ncbi:hypothetical protein [Microbispora hainanensis]|uniref:hypothetical protein n=1 Tax=Microbispora hainanensis TaxID=568844 RepID=UPI00142EC782|nr:hypothetical protein [Microbispora hainanensis]
MEPLRAGGRRRTPRAARRSSRALMYALTELPGQEYAGKYAAAAKTETTGAARENS